MTRVTHRRIIAVSRARDVPNPSYRHMRHPEAVGSSPCHRSFRRPRASAVPARSLAAATLTSNASSGKQAGAAFGDMVDYFKTHPLIRTTPVEKTDRLSRNPKELGGG